MPGPKKKPSGGYGRFNAIVRGGWLVVLTHAEQSMWMAYQTFADADGVAYPDAKKLAELIGHASKSHIGELRQALERYGLLRVLEVGGGRGRRFKVQLLTPPPAPKVAEPRLFEDAEKVPAHGNLSETDKGSRIEGVKVPEIDRKGSRTGEHYKEEQTIEQTREQTISPAAAPAASDLDEPKGKKFPEGVWKRATDGIVRAYAHAHGTPPIFTSRGWKAWADVLSALKGNLDELAAVVRAALREEQFGRWRGHPPWVVLDELNYLRSKIAKGQVGNGTPSHDNRKGSAGIIREQLTL